LGNSPPKFERDQSMDRSQTVSSHGAEGRKITAGMWLRVLAFC
jgi:hypothetical protein